MNKVYPFFPLNANVMPGNGKSLLTPVVIYIAACVVLRVLSWALGWVPLAGWLLELVFSLVGLYCVAGIIVAMIQYFK